MSQKLHFKIATPERVIYEGDIDELVCPTQMGEVGILPNHIPLVANIVPGELQVITDGESKNIFVAGGFLEVQPDNRVVVLADAAENIAEIDEKRAEEARSRAKKAMTEKTLGEEEYATAAAALERSLTRLRVLRKHRHKDVGRTP